MNSTPCPCGINLNLKDCCGRYIYSGQNPESPEKLMRSRYTAYTLLEIPYLKKTWHVDTCPDDLDQLKPMNWVGLQVLNSSQNNKKGRVEFIAKYFSQGKIHELHEKSHFVLINDRWIYYSD